MAFLRLAASARDDTNILLSQTSKHALHRKRHGRKNNVLRKLVESLVDEDGDHDAGDGNSDSCNSLPPDWKDGSGAFLENHDLHHPIINHLNKTTNSSSSSSSSSSSISTHNSHKSPLRSLSLAFWKRPKLNLKQLPARAATFHPKAITAIKWRERRRVRAFAPIIQSAVEARVEAAPFLATTTTTSSTTTSLSSSSSRHPQPPEQDTTPNNSKVASDNVPVTIPRNQLSLRFWLGNGGFCEVWEVECSSFASPTKQTVFKHLKSSLLHHHHHHHHHHRSTAAQSSSPEHDPFVQGAIDLRMEALYLSRLQHKNIIQLYGTVQPPTSMSSIEHNHKLVISHLPYGDGRCDGFGLLLEPLSDTLDQRLDDWKRLALYNCCDEDDSSYHSQVDDMSCASPGWLFKSVSNNNKNSSSSNDNNNNNSNLSKEHLNRVVHYALQIADALEYLHDRRIVLSDVKPNNIGFTDEHTIKLFDFGLCQSLPTDSSVDTVTKDEDRRLYTLPVAGTPIYLPGEVLVQRKYNCLADVYSFSMVLYEMLTLTKPYGDYKSSPSQHYEKVAKGGERPPLEMVVPKAFHSILEHSWDANVQERWTMRRVRQELLAIQKELGITTPVTTNRYTSSYHRRRQSSSLHYLDLEVSNNNNNNNKEAYDNNKNTKEMTADDFEQLFAACHGRE